MNPQELEGDMREWGEDVENNEVGLKALGFPTGEQGEFSAYTGRPPQPDYFPNGKIKALNLIIWGMEGKYKKLLICIYVFSMSDREIGRIGLCDRKTVPKRLKKAKQILINSRYWET